MNHHHQATESSRRVWCHRVGSIHHAPSVTISRRRGPGRAVMLVHGRMARRSMVRRHAPYHGRTAWSMPRHTGPGRAVRQDALWCVPWRAVWTRRPLVPGRHGSMVQDDPSGAGRRAKGRQTDQVRYGGDPCSYGRIAIAIANAHAGIAIAASLYGHSNTDPAHTNEVAWWRRFFGKVLDSA